MLSVTVKVRVPAFERLPHELYETHGGLDRLVPDRLMLPSSTCSVTCVEAGGVEAGGSRVTGPAVRRISRCNNRSAERTSSGRPDVHSYAAVPRNGAAVVQY